MDSDTFLAVLDYNTLYTRMGVKIPTYTTLTILHPSTIKLIVFMLLEMKLVFLHLKFLIKHISLVSDHTELSMV